MRNNYKRLTQEIRNNLDEFWIIWMNMVVFLCRIHDTCPFSLSTLSHKLKNMQKKIAQSATFSDNTCFFFGAAPFNLLISSYSRFDLTILFHTQWSAFAKQYTAVQMGNGLIVIIESTSSVPIAFPFQIFMTMSDF